MVERRKPQGQAEAKEPKPSNDRLTDLSGSTRGAESSTENRRQIGDLKRRLFFLLGALIVLPHPGTHVPVPNINASRTEEIFKSQQGGILGFVQRVLRAARCSASRSSRWASCRTSRHPSSCSWHRSSCRHGGLEEGQAGRRKITQYAVRHTGTGVFPGYGYRHLRWKVSRVWSWIRASHSVYHGDYAGDGHDVPDVARRQITNVVLVMVFRC